MVNEKDTVPALGMAGRGKTAMKQLHKHKKECNCCECHEGVLHGATALKLASRSPN